MEASGLELRRGVAKNSRREQQKWETRLLSMRGVENYREEE